MSRMQRGFCHEEDIQNILTKLEELENANTYSTNETVAGKWEDKTLYRKMISVGQLPNKDMKSIPTDLTNVTYRNIYGGAFMANDTRSFLPINSVRGDVSYSILGRIDNDHITIEAGLDRSLFIGYVIIEYTKNNE